MDLKRESSVPMYQQIADQIIALIKTSPIHPGEKLPTEQELIEKYEVSRSTVRKAVSRLVDEGIVVLKQGKGTFVKESTVELDFNSLRGIYEMLESPGLNSSTEILSYEKVQPPKRILESLGCAPDTELYALRRLFKVDGNPMAYSIAYLSPEAAFTRKQVEELKIYTLLQKELHITLKEAQFAIEAKSAPDEIVGIFDVKRGFPLLTLQRTTFCTHDRPWETSVVYFYPDVHQFKFTITNTESHNK
jgi:GntR family transcriptional regulator